MIISTFLLAAFTLVGAEKSAKVVIPENAEPSTRLCVEELTNYVAKITGKVLCVERGAFRRNAPAGEIERVGGESRSTADDSIANRKIEKSKNPHWLVWLLNNKGMTKFQREEQQIDHACDAKVKVVNRVTGESREVIVPAGGWTTVQFDTQMASNGKTCLSCKEKSR